MIIKLLLTGIAGLAIGAVAGFLVFKDMSPQVISGNSIAEINKTEIIGFLPYWLIENTSPGFEKHITTLTYFGLTLDSNAKIKKYDKPGEKEPGWHALDTGKMDQIFRSFSNSGKKLSLLVFCTEKGDIKTILLNPGLSANNLMEDIDPILTQYNFSDLNLDIEDLTDESANNRADYSEFVRILSEQLKARNITLTIDVSPTEMIRKRMIDVEEISKYANKIVVMGYDYHYRGSGVTGPVGPLKGVESSAEYDVSTAIKLMLNSIPGEKIILGIPLYGYEWETLGPNPRMAVIPGSGLVASDRRIEQLIQDCDDCKLEWDEEGRESYLIIKNEKSQSYRQIFYPDYKATKAKVEYVNNANLGGVAVWALGYEDSQVLNPLAELE